MSVFVFFGMLSSVQPRVVSGKYDTSEHRRLALWYWCASVLCQALVIALILLCILQGHRSGRTNQSIVIEV